jgi:hypothetical protein
VLIVWGKTLWQEIGFINLTTQSRGPPWKHWIQASYHPARRSLILVVRHQNMISNYIKKASDLSASIFGDPNSWSFVTPSNGIGKSCDVIFTAYIQEAGTDPGHGALLCLDSAQGFACDEWYSSVSEAEKAASEYFPLSALCWTTGA